MDKEAFAIKRISEGHFRWDDDFVLVGPRGRIERTRCRGYRAASFFVKKGKKVTVLQHRLVYRCFVGAIPEKMTVNHRDGNKLNNEPSNLELLSVSDNTYHSLDTLGNRYAASPFTRGHLNVNSKLNPEEVISIRQAYSSGEGYRSLAKKYGISPISAYQVVKNKSYFDPGYIPREGRFSSCRR